MTSENTMQHTRSSETADPARGPEKLGSLDVWARSAPIRLAGYEDDLAEPHILPGVD